MRGDESKRTHHVLIRMGEWRRSQEFVDFVVDFGEDVEEGKKRKSLDGPAEEGEKKSKKVKEDASDKKARKEALKKQKEQARAAVAAA